MKATSVAALLGLAFLLLVNAAAAGDAPAVPGNPGPSPDEKVPRHPLGSMLNLTPEHEAKIKTWSPTSPKPDALADFLHANLDPARRALLDVVIKAGGQPPRDLPQPSLILDESADTQTLSAQPGQYLAIALPANITTGFAWSVKSIEGGGLKAEGEMRYYPAAQPAGQPPRVGSGGAAAQAFHVTAPGAAKVTLTYARPWEKDQPPARTLQFSVKAEQPGPLSVKLIANKTTYALRADLEGKTEADLKNRRDQPAPPAVDLELVVTNVSDKPVTLMRGADQEQVILELAGPGAVSVNAMAIMTREFRFGKPTELAAGESFTLKINKLAFGMRGISRHAYWTQPGDYTLKARYQGVEAKAGQRMGAGKRITAETASIRLNVTKE